MPSPRRLAATVAAVAAAVLCGCGSVATGARVVPAGHPRVVVHPAVAAARPGGAIAQPTPVAQTGGAGAVAAASVLPGEAQRGAAAGATTAGPAADISGLPPQAATGFPSGSQALIQAVGDLGAPAALAALGTLTSVSTLLRSLPGGH